MQDQSQFQCMENMEGWLYLISSNRFGIKTIRKRYFVLDESSLKSFKSKPNSNDAVPIGSALINSRIHLTDEGKKQTNKKVLYLFTLHNISNEDEQLKLGANSSEESFKWIQSLKDAMLKENQNSGKDLSAHSSCGWQSIRRMGRTRRTLSGSSADWIHHSSAHVDTDVSAPPSWKIVGVLSGLRLFKEAKSGINQQLLYGPSALMSVGVVDGTPEAIFNTIMSLGPSRSEWDFCFYKGSVIEQLDSQTDIIHEQLDRDWLPWGMQRRDLLLRRYWRKDDDNTYVILYNSAIHKKCPPQNNFIRAFLKSGGYLITPATQGKQSIVRYMLSIDWKSWRSQIISSSSRTMTITMLERVAGLRELFKAKSGSSNKFSSGDFIREIKLESERKDRVSVDVQITEQTALIRDEAKRALANTSLMDLDDASEEFFDIPEPITYGDDWSSEFFESENLSPDYNVNVTPTESVKAPNLGDQEKVENQEGSQVEEINKSYGSTLPEDPNCALACSWAVSNPSLFLIRGDTYFIDQKKVKAKETLMELIGVDWLKSDKREDDLAGRPGSVVQKYADQGGPEFFIVINIQVPGATMYSLALYYMTNTPLEENKLLDRFVNGDAAFRNSKLKLIPYVSKGSWIVKQTVGKKACLVGQALDIHYFNGKNYLEVAIDVGSSSVAKGVVSLVLGYLTNLVIEMAFLVQADDADEFPECLLGTCRLNHLDVAKSVRVAPS
ncbi:hypothetical protein V2J09_008341 [Rumex salicifolius]